MVIVSYISAAAIAILLLATPANAVTVLTGQQAANVFKFDQLNLGRSEIAGVITNVSPHPVRDVELLVQYHWLWKDERNPGTDSPGRSATIKLAQPLEPGQSARFTHTLSPPLPSRSDGSFMPELDIASFTVIIPQNMAVPRPGPVHADGSSQR
jgi:hypothetical protein